jgi:inner membrane protein
MSFKKISKLLLIVFLTIALGISLVAVLGTVSERSERRAEVYGEMGKIIAESQTIVGPVVVIPYELHTQKSITDKDGRRQTSTEIIRREHFILPKHLTIDGQMKVESRFRSLYEFLMYGTQINFKGNFSLSKSAEIFVPTEATLHKLSPYLVVMVKDNRGMTTIPLVSWNAKSLPVQAGLNGLKVKSFGGFHSNLPLDALEGDNVSFSINMYLRGTQSFGFVPIGEETRATIQSDWPHPSFQGAALPKSHKIFDQGFRAEWDATYFSTNISEFFLNDLDPLTLQKQEVVINLVQPVDIYQQTERSLKYGFLMIGLTFAAFMAFETIKQLSIHPIQYAFVGLDLVIFYVLLLALSEHISFDKAYGSASLASIGLLAFYLRYVLRSWKHAISFAVSIALLNSVIYGILMSEDYALLYGAIMLFSLLAIAMIATRRVDWNMMPSGEGEQPVK